LKVDLDEVKQRILAALAAFTAADRYLLEHDLSERCIAARFAMHLQPLFPDHCVDVEYNRKGRSVKYLALPAECANTDYLNEEGESLVVPDLIVHCRGSNGPNLLVLEFKKTANRDGFDCDRERVRAFKQVLRYDYGALIECETRRGMTATIRVAEWI
jgi:hypothetical protein